MKKTVVCILFIVLAASIAAQNYKLGTSFSAVKPLTVEKIIEARKNGFEYIEVTINTCFRKLPENEVDNCIENLKGKVDSADMRVWSVHLPFSKKLDISVLDDKDREENLCYMAHMIEQAARFKPFKLVLHPSSEPISDEERERRIQNCIQSVKYLKPYADKIGAQLCVENLPRTCLGNTPEEMARILKDLDGVGFCFDTNHYLTGNPLSYLELLGDKLGTIHVSDYDMVDERHWIPGQGTIEWGRMMDLLMKKRYKGVFMFEVSRSKENKLPIDLKELADSYKLIADSYKNDIQTK